MKLCKLLFAVVGATVLLGALVSTASARSFRIAPGNQRATYRNVEFIGGFGTTRCDVTLEGSLHRETMQKILEALIGYITRASVSTRCAAGSATILEEFLPWHIHYGGFTAPEALPRISTVNIRFIGAAFRVREPFGLTCLAFTTTAEPGFGIYRLEASGGVFELEISGEIRVGAECGSQMGRLSGRSSTLSSQGSTTRITIHLI